METETKLTSNWVNLISKTGLIKIIESSPVLDIFESWV